MSAVTSSTFKKPKLIYVYALVDREKFCREPDIVKHAVYIGKGTGGRMSEHMQEVRKCLENDTRLENVSNKKKLESLIKAVENGREIQAIRISAGYLSDQDAYRAETLAITIVNSHRLWTAKVPPLLNAVNGHHSQRIADMQEHFLYAQAEEELLPEAPEEYAILLKVNAKELSDQRWAALKIPFEFRDNKIPNIVVMSQCGDKAVRRPWDPMNPWTEQEAFDRARRYWPFKVEKLVKWINGAQDRPKWVLAGVPDGRDTVVRYAWKIDWLENWESFPSGFWGIPLKMPHEKHPLLGKRLVENRFGKATQVLAAYAKGVRVIGIRKS